jgi:transposase
MSDAIVIPNDLESCKTLIAELISINAEQSEVIASRDNKIEEQGEKLDELLTEMEKLRKLLSQLVNGPRSEKRIFSGPEQAWLPFENEEELKAAQAEAEAEAEKVIQEYTVKRHSRKNKPRNESFPAHLPRVEVIADIPEEMKNCLEHGERTIIGYDTTSTLVREPPKLYVIETQYAKLACTGNPQCGIASPERPTGLVEGNRYDTSIAATVIEAKWGQYMPIYRQQDVFASSGWTPSRSTLLNLVTQAEFVISPMVDYMTRLVQQDIGVGMDDTGCRMLLPKEIPEVIAGDAKSKRLAEKVAEVRAAGKESLLAKMWVYSGLYNAPFNIFDFRVSRHRDGPDDFFKTSQCKVQGDCFSGNTSVVIHSDQRLEFVACWAHARRKVVEATTYKAESTTLLQMLQALYDIETRATKMTWQERQQLRERESTVVLAAVKKWLDSPVVADVLPKSDFAAAIRYIRNHWDALNVYVHDGRIPIDNNRVEQLMKQVALGRKAWLFVGTVEAGERSAMMMSLVSSAKRHDLDVGLYIQDVLDQLLAGSTDYHSLLPDQWKLSHPEAVRVYRQEERRDKADRKQLGAARRRLARLKC